MRGGGSTDTEHWHECHSRRAPDACKTPQFSTGGGSSLGTDVIENLGRLARLRPEPKILVSTGQTISPTSSAPEPQVRFNQR